MGQQIFTDVIRLFKKSGTFFSPSDLHLLCLVGLKCCLPPLKDGCPFKVLQRLGIQLTRRFSRSNVSHIFICSFPPVSAMNIMSGEGGGGAGGRRGGKVRCSQGGSRLMNVCSVLITPLNYINPPSELRRVTRTEGSAESKVKPPPLPRHPPQIPVSSLNSSLLFIFACSPTLTPPRPLLVSPSTIPRRSVALLFLLLYLHCRSSGRRPFPP